MTFLPIAVFAVLDFEHEKKRDRKQKEVSSRKKYFMNDPELYEIGLKH